MPSDVYLRRACFSTDAGATWIEAAPGQLQPNRYLGDIYFGARFIGDSGGIVRDGQGLWWSNPIGSPWQRVFLNRDFDGFSRIGLIDSTHLWGEAGASTYFTADNQNWISFLPASPDLTRSYQYGIQSTIGDASNYVFDAQRGLQLWRGKLYLTEDNGVSRTPVTLAGSDPVPVGSVGAGVFLNVKQGFVVSAQSTLLQSDDGGKAWAASTTLPAGTVYNVWTGPEQSLWVSGRFTDQGGPEDRLLRSLDGGKTWTTAYKGTALDVQFVDRSHGWLNANNQVFRTADLGQTWQAAGALGTDRMRFLDAMRGVAGASFFAGSSSPRRECLQTTEDGGNTWSACAKPAVASGTGLGGVAVGAGSYWLFNSSGLHRSKDLGKTWTPVSLPGPKARLGGLRDLMFVDAQQGWLVSAMGGIWATSDGGETWALQPAITSADLKRLSIVDARAVWVFGANTILGTATGGKLVTAP